MRFIAPTAKAIIVWFEAIDANEMNIGATSFDMRSIRFMPAFRTCSGGFDVCVVSVGTFHGPLVSVAQQGWVSIPYPVDV
jgi:hypothetical protein